MHDPRSDDGTYIVIFRARVRQFDDEYFQTAARMREPAIQEFGCLEFQAVTEGPDEVALSYWPGRGVDPRPEGPSRAR